MPHMAAFPGNATITGQWGDANESGFHGLTLSTDGDGFQLDTNIGKILFWFTACAGSEIEF
jgi:hypothetical protein